MAIYAGETVRIYADIQGWDDTPLGVHEVNSATVVITDRNGAVVQAGTMVWISEEGRWRYDWDSPPVAGPYSIEVVFDTPEGTSVDVRKVRLDAPRTVREVVRGPFVVRE